MNFKVIILQYRTDGYTPTGQCIGRGLTEEQATAKAKDYNQGKGREGMGPQAATDGGSYAVAVPDQDD